MGRHEGLGVGYAPAVADGFFIHIVRTGDDFTVIATGELDPYASSVLEQQVRGFIEPGAVVVIDLGDVSFLDSTGLQMLCTLRQRQVAAGGRLLLKSPSAAVQRALEAARLTTMFDVVDRRTTAPPM